MVLYIEQPLFLLSLLIMIMSALLPQNVTFVSWHRVVQVHGGLSLVYGGLPVAFPHTMAFVEVQHQYKSLLGHNIATVLRL